MSPSQRTRMFIQISSQATEAPFPKEGQYTQSIGDEHHQKIRILHDKNFSILEKDEKLTDQLQPPTIQLAHRKIFSVSMDVAPIFYEKAAVMIDLCLLLLLDSSRVEVLRFYTYTKLARIRDSRPSDLPNATLALSLFIAHTQNVAYTTSAKIRRFEGWK